MSDIQERQQQAHNKVILRTVILGIVIGIIIGGSFLMVVPIEPAESVIIQEGAAFTGDTDNTIEYSSYVGSTDTTIFDITDFSRLPILSFRGHGTQLELEHQSEGFILTGTEYHIVIETNFHLLVYDYNNMNLTIDYSINVGTVNVSIIVTFPQLDSIYIGEKYTLSDHTESEIIFEMPFDFIKNHAEHWLLETSVRIGISSKASSEIAIERLSADVLSNELVYPLNVQFLDQGGNNIYSNEYSNYLGRYPFLNISEKTLSYPSSYQQALVTGRANNGTVYLPVGNYTFEYGWSPADDPDIVGVIDVEMQPGMQTVLTIGLETIRLFIETPENIPVYIDIYDPDYRFLLEFHKEVRDDRFFLYFPANTRSLEIRFNIAGSFSAYSGAITINMNSTHDIHLQIEFPLFQFLWFALDAAQILFVLIIIGGLFASLISLHRLVDYRPIKTLFESQEIFPFFLIILSVFAPWSFDSGVTLDKGNIYHLYTGIHIVTGITMLGGSDRLSVFVPSDFLFTVIIQLLFGFCIILILVRIFTDYFSESTSKMLVPYLLPVVLSIFYIIEPYPSWYFVSIGPFIPIAALLIVLFQPLLSKRRRPLLGSRKG